jgi:hypothetical protein
MAELDGRAHLAALDQVGMGLEDQINLGSSGNRVGDFEGS